MKLIIAGCVTFGLISMAFAESPAASETRDWLALGQGSEQITAPPSLDHGRQVEGLVIWDNGGFVTHPGAGVGGTDISMASEAENSAGSNARKWEDNEFFRIADRFEVVTAAEILQISTFAYEPFRAPPTWTSLSLRIWSGAPGESGSQVLFEREYEGLDVAFTGVYRILHLGEFTDVRRPIYEVLWDLTSSGESTPLWLEPGDYWIDWQVVGGTTGWVIYVMEPNPDDPDQPTTVSGDSLQLQPGGWVDLGVATPFLVLAVSDDLFRDRFEETDPSADDVN